MEEEILSLKWNNHNVTFMNAISALYKDDSNTDVTLACNEKYYRVHRVVLSICSEYFCNIFKQIQCQHPIIVLKDICHQELEILLNYMYAGEANVSQSTLPSLIKAAEWLKIKGLAVPDEENLKLSKKKSKSSCKRKREEEKVIESNEESSLNCQPEKVGLFANNDQQMDVKVKEEYDDGSKVEFENDLEYITSFQTPSEPHDNSLYDQPDFQDTGTSQSIQSSSTPIESQSWNQNFEDSISDVDASVPMNNVTQSCSSNFICPYCSKKLFCKSLYERHIVSHTGEKPFQCPYCPHRGTRKFSLRKHIEKFHLQEHLKAIADPNIETELAL